MNLKPFLSAGELKLRPAEPRRAAANHQSRNQYPIDCSDD